MLSDHSDKPGLGGSLHDGVVAGVRNAQQQVFSKRTIHQPIVLGEVADIVSQHVLGNLAHVQLVDEQSALRRTVKACGGRIVSTRRSLRSKCVYTSAGPRPVAIERR